MGEGFARLKSLQAELKRRIKNITQLQTALQEKWWQDFERLSNGLDRKYAMEIEALYHKQWVVQQTY